MTTTVERRLRTVSEHTWTAGETRDALDVTGHDNSVVTTAAGHQRPSVTRQKLTYTKQGAIVATDHQGIPDAQDITTHLRLGDVASTRTHGPGTPATHESQSDTFQGRASWIYNVPRDQRHATGHSAERFERHGGGLGCYDHQLRTVNGYFTVDRDRC